VPVHVRGHPCYLYLLTPSGIEEKARVTYEFLRLKSAEIDQLRKEIDTLRKEYGGQSSTADSPAPQVIPRAGEKKQRRP